QLEANTIEETVTGDLYGALDIGAAMVAQTLRKAVPYRYTAAAGKSRLVSEKFLFQYCCSHQDLPGRSGRVAILYGAIAKRFLRIVEQFRVVGFELRRCYTAREEVRIIGRMRDHCPYTAVARIVDNDRAVQAAVGKGFLRRH